MLSKPEADVRNATLREIQRRARPGEYLDAYVSDALELSSKPGDGERMTGVGNVFSNKITARENITDALRVAENVREVAEIIVDIGYEQVEREYRNPMENMVHVTTFVSICIALGRRFGKGAMGEIAVWEEFEDMKLAEGNALDSRGIDGFIGDEPTIEDGEITNNEDFTGVQIKTGKRKAEYKEESNDCVDMLVYVEDIDNKEFEIREC